MATTKFDRIENKLDKITEHLASVDSILASQNVDLKIHIKRTDLLESKVEKSEEFINRQVGAIKLLMIVISIVAACETLVHWMK